MKYFVFGMMSLGCISWFGFMCFFFYMMSNPIFMDHLTFIQRVIIIVGATLGFMSITYLILNGVKKTWEYLRSIDPSLW